MSRRRKYVAKEEVLKEESKANQCLKDLSESLGISKQPFEIFVEIDEIRKHPRPIKAYVWAQPSEPFQWDRDSQVHSKAIELVDSFPYNGWYVKKEEDL